MAALPPNFCWKKGGDAGRIPTDCPDDYKRIGIGICRAKCKSHYKDVAGVCWKGFKSYVPKSISNFDKDIPCRENEYKSGALCYRDCRDVGMINCGIGACSISKSGCGSAVAQMSISAITTIGSAILEVTTMGAATGGVAAMKMEVTKAASKLGPAGI